MPDAMVQILSAHRLRAKGFSGKNIRKASWRGQVCHRIRSQAGQTHRGNQFILKYFAFLPMY